MDYAVIILLPLPQLGWKSSGRARRVKKDGSPVKARRWNSELVWISINSNLKIFFIFKNINIIMYGWLWSQSCSLIQTWASLTSFVTFAKLGCSSKLMNFWNFTHLAMTTQKLHSYFCFGWVRTSLRRSLPYLMVNSKSAKHETLFFGNCFLTSWK